MTNAFTGSVDCMPRLEMSSEQANLPRIQQNTKLLN